MENKRFNAPFLFNGFINRTEWIISVLLFWGYYYLVVLGVKLRNIILFLCIFSLFLPIGSFLPKEQNDVMTEVTLDGIF